MRVWEEIKLDSKLKVSEECNILYIIKINEIYYIGSSKEGLLRINYHRSCLRGNYHPNKKLQLAYNSVDEDTVIVSFCKVESKVDLIEAEKELSEEFIREGISICNHKIGNNYTEAEKREIKKRASKLSTRIKLSEASKKQPTKGCISIDANGVEVEYKSLAEAGRAMGRKNGGNDIGACCRGLQKTAFGLIWKYK